MVKPKMKRTLRKIYGYANRLGFDPLTGAANLRGVPNFVADLQAFKIGRAHV